MLIMCMWKENFLQNRRFLSHENWFSLVENSFSTPFWENYKKCCSLVCVVYYKKAARSLSASDIQSSQAFLIDGYSSLDPNFPNGVCTGCNIVLSKKRKDSTTALPVAESYHVERKMGLGSVNKNFLGY